MPCNPYVNGIKLHGKMCVCKCPCICSIGCRAGGYQQVNPICKSCGALNSLLSDLVEAADSVNW